MPHYNSTTYTRDSPHFRTRWGGQRLCILRLCLVAISQKYINKKHTYDASGNGMQNGIVSHLVRIITLSYYYNKHSNCPPRKLVEAVSVTDVAAAKQPSEKVF